ncbi:hypothetical protein [Flavobacterium capsici]|uniref:Uncharacterized protein n=1 Tax=Flavobacterium capsici TaxID=3075618 RepID=A0AA96EW73_9FLAO|nr:MULTISPECIES: hypothetical protein [unclassified Flavobacterium]WNM19102.1 hypothetical protein RN608_00105 [Flavobacterium sp. PMR2A8]WNM20491.1 hypothetical protein RN605_07275 [Flavobacterium sp. PMTSA4]
MINNQKKKFKSTILNLQRAMVQLTVEQKKQSQQLVLSEDLKQKIVQINQTISQSVYELGFELFKQNYPKRTT